MNTNVGTELDSNINSSDPIGTIATTSSSIAITQSSKTSPIIIKTEGNDRPLSADSGISPSPSTSSNNGSPFCPNSMSNNGLLITAASLTIPTTTLPIIIEPSKNDKPKHNFSSAVNNGKNSDQIMPKTNDLAPIGSPMGMKVTQPSISPRKLTRANSTPLRRPHNNNNSSMSNLMNGWGGLNSLNLNHNESTSTLSGSVGGSGWNNYNYAGGSYNDSSSFFSSSPLSTVTSSSPPTTPSMKDFEASYSPPEIDANQLAIIFQIFSSGKTINDFLIEQTGINYTLKYFCDNPTATTTANPNDIYSTYASPSGY